MVWDPLEDNEGAMFLENMEEAEQMEEEETFEEEKRDNIDMVHSEFTIEGLKVKLYTIEEESSEYEDEREEEEEEDEWMGLKRLQDLSELQRYFLLLAGQHEFSQQF